MYYVYIYIWNMYVYYMFFVFSAFFSSNTHHWYFQILLKTPQLHRCHARSRSSSTCAAKPSRGPNFSSSERKGPWDVWEVMGKPWENHGKTYGKPMENLWTCLEKISMKYHMMFWLVVWNMFFSIQLGMSSSQLTKSIIFQRGRYTTNQIFMNRRSTILHGFLIVSQLLWIQIQWYPMVIPCYVPLNSRGKTPIPSRSNTKRGLSDGLLNTSWQGLLKYGNRLCKTSNASLISSQEPTLWEDGSFFWPLEWGKMMKYHS